MNNLYHDIVIDLAHVGFPESVTVKQYDDQIPHVRIELLQNGVKYLIPLGTMLRMQGTKPDKSHFMCDVSRTEDGRVDCTLSEQILAAAGPVLTEVRMTDATGALSTFNFYIYVQKAALQRSDITSSNEYQSIDKIKADTLQYKNDAEAAKTAAEAAKNAAAGSAATATQQAQTAQIEAQKVQKIVAGNEAYTKDEVDLEFSRAPRKTATGKGELVLPDSDRGKAYVELAGASEQYTNTANKNLIDLHFAKDGYYVNNISGELSVNPNYMASSFIEVFSGESYFLSNGSAASPGAMYNANKVYVQGITAGLNVIPDGVKYVRISAVKTKQAPYTTQFERGTQGTEIVIGAVETPSPEYPSEVQSVGDIPKDVNGVEIRNLLDEDLFKNAVISLSKSAYTWSEQKFSPGTYRTEAWIIKNKKNITVILSKNKSTATGDYARLISMGTTYAGGTLTIPEGSFGYIGVIWSDLTDAAVEDIENYKFMITNAAEIDDYRPYIGENNGLVKLESTEKNLADMEYMLRTYPAYITKEDDRYKIAVPSPTGSGVPKFPIEIKQNATYCFRAKVQNEKTGYWAAALYVFYTDGTSDAILIHDHSNLNEDLLTRIYIKPSAKTIDSFGFASANNVGYPAYFRDVQIEMSDKVTDYQAYQQQITWIPLKEPLRGIKGSDTNFYSDKIDKNGYVTQNIYFKQGKGMSSFSTDATGINTTDSQYKWAYWSPEADIIAFSGTKTAICNVLKRGNFNVNQMVIANTTVVIFNLPNTLTGVANTETDRAVIAAAIKKWVNTNNPLVYYVLEKPITYQIPAIHVETYDPETHIRCLNKVTPDMEVDYKKSLEKVLSDLQNAILALGGTI